MAQENLLEYRLAQAEKLQLLWRVGELLKKKQNSFSHYIISYFQGSATSSPLCHVNNHAVFDEYLDLFIFPCLSSASISLIS